MISTKHFHLEPMTRDSGVRLVPRADAPRAADGSVVLSEYEALRLIDALEEAAIVAANADRKRRDAYPSRA
jgi:hypothetical protein